jgi:hypothetical protein
MPVFRQGRSVPAVVIIEEQRISTCLREKPQLGARLDVGCPVVVVDSKDVAGGGVIVAAARLDGASPAD